MDSLNNRWSGGLVGSAAALSMPAAVPFRTDATRPPRPRIRLSELPGGLG